jgi:hypothetical protein
VRAVHKVLIEVRHSILLNVGDPEGILDQQLKPHPIHSPNITVLIKGIK